jgi:smad nuclear-interacting protein 1
VSKPIPLKERSCWLLGREDRVADLPVLHGSVSKQHCVIQFRNVTGEDGRKSVKPYVIDLESSNGTTLNGERIPGGRYVQVKSGDIFKVGSSGRDYVFLLAPKG